MAPLEPLVDRALVENSSNIKSRGYDAARLVLAAEFKNGTIYHHHGVPLTKFNTWLQAESAGEFYNREIRGKYPSIKMTGHCPRCGAQGLVGVTCVDCGCAECETDPRPGKLEPAALRKARDKDIDARLEHDPRD